MVIMMSRLVDPVGMLVMRVEWLALTLALILGHRLFQKYQQRFAYVFPFLRVLGQMAWLAKWYPDTYEFNRCFNNLDHIFIAADQQLFGCQPALEFSRALPQALWSEAFNLGYWSYFPMICTLVIAVFLREYIVERPASITPAFVRQSLFMQVATTIMTAFFLYYAIYIFLPVAGPQFYFQAVGVDNIMQGHFPALGTYFSNHTEMLPAPGYSDGLFYDLVSGTQATGERPTAAFPSSHIGISTILLLLARRHFVKLLPFLLPFWALLCCATVYIQAHYLVDAIAGLISAPIILYLAQTLNTISYDEK